MDIAELLKYIGSDYNEQIQIEINKKFEPYMIQLCDIENYYLENFWHNQIRCVVDKNKIIKLQFN